MAWDCGWPSTPISSPILLNRNLPSSVAACGSWKRMTMGSDVKAPPLTLTFLPVIISRMVVELSFWDAACDSASAEHHHGDATHGDPLHH